ncbi:MAG: hypothetical protein LBN00_03620 [Oscillospiraceae bacterium]|jgi:hypothetical protein|nr:hypothetical protein [Oscillospiraceae bacterium]
MTTEKTKNTLEVITAAAHSYIQTVFDGNANDDAIIGLCKQAVEHLADGDTEIIARFAEQIEDALGDSDGTAEVAQSGDLAAAMGDLASRAADESNPSETRSLMLRTAILLGIYHNDGLKLTEQLALAFNV